MAVFWFGWAKKIKNIFTKQQADQYYLQKELPNQLQIVKGNVDFYKNVVIKQNGYVDRVDTNAPTSMINKRYLEEQTLSKTSTASQTVAGQVSFSGGVISRSSTEFGTEIKAGYGGGAVKFIPEDNSTKTLQFYNNNATDTRRFKLLVSDPTESQNPATKQYVDNARQYIAVFENTSTVYNNLDKIQLTNPADFTLIERNIPWIIRFDRIVKNGGAYEGTVSYSFMLPDRGKATFATSRMYYVASSGNFEEGSRVGISIKVVGPRAYELKIQIWDQAKAIKNVYLYKPQV